MSRLRTQARPPLSERPPLRLGSWLRPGALGAAAFAVLTGCSTTVVLDKLVPTHTYVSLPSARYGPDARQQLDIYVPLAEKRQHPTPMVVFFYGGSWSSGDRADYRFVGEALASRGIITLVADYRLSPQVRYPQFLQDSAKAVKWAFDHARGLGADPQRIYLVGHSAGGYNAAMLALDARWLEAEGLQPAQLAGWAGLAGAYNFLPIGVPEVQVAFNWPDTAADTQPIYHARSQAGFPPALLLAASSDTSVNPQRNTGALAERLQAQGVPVQLKYYEKLSHATLVGAVATPLNFLAPVAHDLVSFVLAEPVLERQPLAPPKPAAAGLAAH